MANYEAFTRTGVLADTAQWVQQDIHGYSTLNDYRIRAVNHVHQRFFLHDVDGRGRDRVTEYSLKNGTFAAVNGHRVSACYANEAGDPEGTLIAFYNHETEYVHYLGNEPVVRGRGFIWIPILLVVGVLIGLLFRDPEIASLGGIVGAVVGFFASGLIMNFTEDRKIHAAVEAAIERAQWRLEGMPVEEPMPAPPSAKRLRRARGVNRFVVLVGVIGGGLFVYGVAHTLRIVGYNDHGMAQLSMLIGAVGFGLATWWGVGRNLLATLLIQTPPAAMLAASVLIVGQEIATNRGPQLMSPVIGLAIGAVLGLIWAFGVHGRSAAAQARAA